MDRPATRPAPNSQPSNECADASLHLSCSKVLFSWTSDSSFFRRESILTLPHRRGRPVFSIRIGAHPELGRVRPQDRFDRDNGDGGRLRPPGRTAPATRIHFAIPLVVKAAAHIATAAVVDPAENSGLQGDSKKVLDDSKCHDQRALDRKEPSYDVRWTTQSIMINGPSTERSPFMDARSCIMAHGRASTPRPLPTDCRSCNDPRGPGLL